MATYSSQVFPIPHSQSGRGDEPRRVLPKGQDSPRARGSVWGWDVGGLCTDAAGQVLGEDDKL